MGPQRDGFLKRISKIGQNQRFEGPDGRWFLVVRIVSKSTVAASMPDRNKICQNGKVPTHPDIHPGPANRQTSFSEGGMHED